MKVLEATDFYYPWIAGPAPFIRDLSTGLSHRGHEVVIACPSPSGKPVDEYGVPALHRVRTWPIPVGHHLRAGFPFLDLPNLVQRWRPDVVHIHHPFPISIGALAGARTHGVPVVATNHTIPACTLFGLRRSWLYRPVSAALSAHIRMVLSAADVVTTPTETAAAMLREMGFSSDVMPISNGVDTRRFHPGIGGEEHGEPVVLYTGRLDDDKDVGTLIDAIPFVLRQARAQFRIGGEGTDRARLEGLVREKRLSKWVRFTGYVPDDELPNVYRSASIYAITSPVELQSISTLEAMASGLPIVAVDAGALHEIVRPSVNGFLASPGEPQALAEAIIRLLVDASLRRGMGAASRRLAEEHSPEATVYQYEQVFQRLACEHKPRTVSRPTRS